MFMYITPGFLLSVGDWQFRRLFSHWCQLLYFQSPQLPRGGTSLRLTLPLGLQPSSVPLTISFPPLIVKIKENPVTRIYSKDQMSVGTTCTNWSLNIKVNIMLRACLYLTDWHI